METYDHRNTKSFWLTAFVALVVLILVTWWVLGGLSWSGAPVGAASDEGATVSEPASLPTAVNAYMQYVEGTRAGDAMAVDHQFTATGIRNLAAALESIATAGGPDVQRELTALREQAGALQQDAGSMDHADRAREMFITLSGLMTAIQAARFPSLQEEVAGVEEAAQGIRADAPLLDQPNAVQTFFDRAASAVRSMARGAAA